MATASVNSPWTKPAPQKLAEKLICDLELLVKSLQVSFKGDEEEASQPISDDNLDLQKFCAKFEFLLQFGLRDRKNGSSSGGNGSVDLTAATSHRHEYWTMLNDVFKSSRGFEDAVKYVKSLSEVKTGLGKARVFLRFCLQYHRLADAIQQLTMEDRVVG